MVAHISTIVLSGIQARGVDVQVQFSSGMAGFHIVGLPDNAVRESRERIRSALHALGLSLPNKRIVVNLAPADLMKEGSHFDLPIAVGMLTEMGILPADVTGSTLFMGELGLDGRLSPVVGCLPAGLFAVRQGKNALFVPNDNAGEATWAGDLDVFGATGLGDLVAHFKGENVLSPAQPQAHHKTVETFPDFADIKGQETAKRVALVAASGGHNMLFSGPPGSGKSMVAQRLPGILPPLSSTEALDVSMIHSVAGQQLSGGLMTRRPFRAPHHSASAAALCGGGIKARPGEVSLAHKGVLFLDELPEFSRNVLETLRQPLENGTITVARANHHITYPARFQLVAAMNPCPCGYQGHPQIPCRCTQKQIFSYMGRISGPLLDRFDLYLDVPAVTAADLSLPPARETSADLAARVREARKTQAERYRGSGITTNAEADGQLLETHATPDEEGRALLTRAAEKMALSARGYHRVLRVARTLADLENMASVRKPHIAEALGFRPMLAGGFKS